MYLEKLELQGFKSFVQKITLEFPHPRGSGRRGITAIVGPNGSGKSNLADAVRWVMGEQSLKTLRSKKSEDVIFSGTDKRARVGLAEVSLHLNNEDRRAPVDYSEVVIKRRLYRSGESEYLLNGNRVRLQDINMLLAEASFGQKTYSIIGQGMVDIILSMGPLERKEFFDEAAGTRHLQLKKEDALRKLEQTAENLRQGEALIQEIAPRLRSLTRQVRRLERRDQVASELKIMQERYYGGYFYELIAEFRLKEKALNDVSVRRVKADEELKKMEAQFAVMEKTAPSGERFEILAKKHQGSWEAKEARRERLLNLRNELARQTVPKQQGQSLMPAQLLSDLAALEASLGSLEDLLKDNAAINAANLKNILRSLQEHLGNLKHLVAGENVGIDSERLAQEIEKLHHEEQTLDKELKSLQQEMQKFQETEDEKNRTFFALERALQSKRQEATALLNEENEYRVVMARLNATRESLEASMREELGESFVLPEQKTALAMSTGEKESLKREIDQLKVRLAEIGSIDPETIREYEETQSRFDFLSIQSKDLKQGIKDLHKIIEDLESTVARQFNDSFQKIAHDFEHFFKVLFKGGHAKLAKVSYEVENMSEETEDEEGAEERGKKETGSEEHKETERVGIEIQATPPGKRLKGINMLSGGERALTSLALICAIISNNPAPFVVLDEVDAALDEANSARLAEIIDQLSHRSQFIVITHNRAIMHEANMLYGVTMGDDGTSKVLSLKMEEIEKKE
ncbi:hypothetical protein A3H10_00205 [Candidatus Uhrbacteria bacterium RIFCSPLOWO2_12_FULL_46_10]|uniref:RecF/RecN/SMC N-terminal domain-containing protein n=1 Tax=Candidatus Uhrbacteria bacterium RIFCSPLOWO2_01_FULL_47_25 TaxID=1802402 RepID=A0A1F7UW00_9BACT|nr:MAG: hypothetical protein A2752_04840 [Candidatus Uhrbacteria bacterium RIFCSPHIGHO2_01_FULL_46_23]OGL69402.1 MAG: hypothetical protein A3D60_00995 [Candidatus Uhrbacteria bacterium RIFCSPHIGHO2_02_FULL_47_29]OGL76795.1 MAG: hypothetical protein A3E96_01650 [Candidatus Uhrbacteria bacterium RIFCSPHIGHO2_12_FULL_46_13]OGL82436.1 MAG: hypothetical protein A2936_03195 [Candidatus Uhrbacteria bacterium RIFCSPLOWO2_01_FULL_47_25]OGL91245.1 MAG: hypothetical protein A3H10_00205 [Candidatus Uhrbact